MNQLFFPLTQYRLISDKPTKKFSYWGSEIPRHKMQLEVDQKQRIMQWLATLSPELQSEVFSFTSYYRVYQIMKLYVVEIEKGQQEYIQYAQEAPQVINMYKKIDELFFQRNLCREKNADPQYVQAHNGILDYVYFSDFEYLYDTISLKGDINLLIQYMQIIDDKIFTKEYKIDMKPEINHIEVQITDFVTNYPYSLSEIIVQEIEKAVLIRYHQSLTGQYLRSVELFKYQNIQLTDLPQETQFPIIQDTNDHDKHIYDASLLELWQKQIKREDGDNYLELLKQPEQLLYVPLKLITKYSTIQAKFVLSQFLLKKFELKSPEQLSEKDGSIKDKKGLQQVKEMFPSKKPSNILPQGGQCLLFSSSNQKQTTEKKEDFKKNQDDDELTVFITDVVQKRIEIMLAQKEVDRKIKSEIKKKKKQQKNQQIMEATTTCTDLSAQNQGPSILDDESNSVKLSKKKKQRQKQKEVKLKQKQKQSERQQKQDELQSQQGQKDQQEKISEIDEMIKDQSLKEQLVEQVDYDEEQKQNNESLEEQIPDQFDEAKPIILQQNIIVLDDGDQLKKQPSKSSKTKTNSHKKRNKQKFKDDSSIDKMQFKQQLQLKKTVSQQPKEEESTVSKIYKTQKKDTPIKEPQLTLEQRITDDAILIYNTERARYQKFKNAREVAIARTHQIIKSLFRFSDTQVYGSYITGLALEDSDVDIVVMGFSYMSKQQLYEPMKQLVDQFHRMKWTVSCKLIFTASVPIIKLEIDPSISYLTFRYSVVQLMFANPDLVNLKIGEPSKNIQLDITFDQCHLGLQSTQFTQECIRQYPGFKETVIVLKKILKIKQLNDAYTGGISSFCLTLFVRAMEQHSSIGHKILSFCHKFGLEFDPSKESVQISQDGNNFFADIDQYLECSLSVQRVIFTFEGLPQE
ncbi:hypothetical protein pb186bvf_001610 [Paramecium bursaria]